MGDVFFWVLILYESEIFFYLPRVTAFLATLDEDLPLLVLFIGLAPPFFPLSMLCARWPRQAWERVLRERVCRRVNRITDWISFFLFMISIMCLTYSLSFVFSIRPFRENSILKINSWRSILWKHFLYFIGFNMLM